MAVYPAGNPGAYPVDPTTPVGQFRLLYGDTLSTAYVPDEPGFQDFEELSDAEIEAFIEQGGDSVGRGVGYYMLSLASKAALQSRSVADYDLKVDLTKRAADLRAAAQMWFDAADNSDAGEDGFDIFSTGSKCGPLIPEAMMPVYGRRAVPVRVC